MKGGTAKIKNVQKAWGGPEAMRFRFVASDILVAHLARNVCKVVDV